MSYHSNSYSKKLLKQREKRNKQKLLYQQTVYSSSNGDSDSMEDQVYDSPCHRPGKASTSTINYFEKGGHSKESYLPDQNDLVQAAGDSTFELDDTPPLYKNSSIRTGEAVKRLMMLFIKSNFDKRKIIALMCLIKTLLPSPNKLPTTFTQILKIFGKKPSSVTKFYCNSCLTLTTNKSGHHYCTNSSCALVNLQLSTRQLTEIVIMNIREKLQAIVQRNFSLFSGHEELFPAFDIPSGARYQSLTSNIMHPITLNIHVDGAALVRSTRSTLWPCFGSIVELPPPLREYQSNILVLGLWVSCIKPDVNLFLEGIIDQLTDLSQNGTTIFVKNYKFEIHVNTQMFVSDLPAKALFMKTINFNGYFACTNCVTEGVYDGTQVMYLYENNNYQSRTHQQFLITARAVEAKLANANRRSISIAGVKGLSSLLKVLRYPVDVVYDYMHLVCLNHTPTLIKRFLEVLSKNDIEKVDSILSTIHLPHDVNVRYNYSIRSINDWKAKDNRLFVLNIGLPILIQHLPILYSSHFAIYCMFVRIVHCPKSIEELQLAEKLIHYYCQTSAKVYGPKIELYSLHAHLHLPTQVLNHGGLAFTSAFCFESAIRYIKRKSHGTKDLGSQIGYWCDIDTIVPLTEFVLSSPVLVNETNLENDLLNPYRGILTKMLYDLQQDITRIKLYLRFKDRFLTYHSFLYGKRFTCNSYLVSYIDNHQQIQYGNIIIFYVFNNISYSLIQRYHRADANISDFLAIPDELKQKVDLFYPICFLSGTYVIIHSSDIVTKCVMVPFQQYQCITERRVSYEHD